jgi:hypothetical protein
MDTVQVYVVAGPNNIYFGGRSVPGGFEYLSRNLFLLAALNGGINFEVNIAHSIYHGKLAEFKQFPNMQVWVHEFNGNDIDGLAELDPVLQHGTLLNELLGKITPHSRFVLILDPDCYAIEENLIPSCLQQMKDSGIAVMGVPYPAWYPKEYSLKTPQLYFCLYDRSKIKIEELDLRAGGGTAQGFQEVISLPRKIHLAVVRRLMAGLLAKEIIKPGSLTETLLNSKINVIQKRYEINPRDTGWRIGELLENEESSYETFPNIVKSELDLAGFNRSEYLKVNEDLMHLGNHLEWYFLVHGLMEGRRLGKQGILPRILNRFIHSRATSLSKWPVTSYVGRDLISNTSDLSQVLGAFPAADCYALHGKFSIFHIGSKGKGHLQNETEILDRVISKFA